jgi:hypothetical protein
MVPRISIQSGQETVTIECELDETLLLAGLRAGIGLP